MIRLICIDVDGTLIGSSGTVRPEIFAEAARLRARGMRFALCSGRPAFGNTRGYALQLDAQGWHVFQNGASVVHLPSARSLSAAIATDTIAILVERARALGRLLELYSDFEYAIENPNDVSRQHADLLGIPYEPRALATLTQPIVRTQWLITRPEVDGVLSEPHPKLEVAPSTSPLMPKTIFVNMTPQGITKGSAVRTVAKEYGIDLDQVMFVGDGGNDIEAMRTVGHPIAMGNAEEDVKRVAHTVVGHVDDGGLLEALQLATRL